MNSSAKTTAFSFLAAAALGAATWMGCTVTSGTVDDTNGGTQNNDQDAGTGSGDQDAGTTDEDSGTTPVGSVCQSNQKSQFVNETCQLCLENNCCTQLQGCFDLPADANAGTVDCNDYNECIDACNQDPAADDSCYALCDETAAEGVKDGYEAIVGCAQSSCATECGGPAEEPDAG